MNLVIDEKEFKFLPITIDPEIVSGTPVFKGTRVPVEALLTNLEAGLSLDEFLEDFPHSYSPTSYPSSGIFQVQAARFSSKELEARVPGLVASVPPGATLPDSSERKPSGIPSAAVDDRSASVSSSFPSRLSLGGSPLLRQSSL
jgi:uncharacterized protein (DUF433 family)